MWLAQHIFSKHKIKGLMCGDSEEVSYLAPVPATRWFLRTIPPLSKPTLSEGSQLLPRSSRVYRSCGAPQGGAPTQEGGILPAWNKPWKESQFYKTEDMTFKKKQQHRHNHRFCRSHIVTSNPQASVWVEERECEKNKVMRQQGGTLT